MGHSVLSSSLQEDGVVLIHSGEQLTIENMAEFVTLIKEGLAAAKSVAVQFHPDLVADITAIQAICSAHRTAATKGKTFVRQGDMPRSLLTLAAALGSDRHRGDCVHNIGHSCPWFEGKEEWQR